MTTWGKNGIAARAIKQDFDTAWKEVDLLACPTTPMPAFRFGEKSADPLAMYLADVYTVSANLAGIPAISIPCGFSAGGLPIGLQLMGRSFGEARRLKPATPRGRRECRLESERCRAG